MDNRKKRGKPAEGEETFFVGTKSTASANDCTGLMQTPAPSEEEKEAYADIYQVPVEGKDYPYRDNKL